MISIELIFPLQGKRLCMRIDRKTTVGDLKRYLRESFKVTDDKIFLLSTSKAVTDDMTLEDAGMYTGSGVLIDDV